jgi:hypothetical protein
MYIRNRKGPNTDPWGTPASIPSHPDENPSFKIILNLYTCIQHTFIDIGKDIRFIFCDISKAFDRVWHTGLLYKLRKIGRRF